LRIIKYHQPKSFLLENVPGLLTIQEGKTFDIIVKALKSAGYSISYRVLDAQNFGLPQIRKRVIIVGFRNDFNVNDDFYIPEENGTKKVPVGKILEKNPKGYTISKHLQESYLFKKDDGRPQVIDENSDIQIKT